MTVAQKYSLSARLGTGAMGDVWSGDRISDGLPVAIKLLLPAAATNTEVVARFRREAQVLSRIDSEYVARVLDFLCDRRLGLVLIMELIPGESLLSVLQRQQRLPIEETLDIAADIVRGLRDLAGAKIVHRDLKPGNIVLRPRDGLPPQAVLVDFGMSRILAGSNEDEELTAITRGDRVLGTLEYMAPEQILGARDVTSLADVYALGAIMFRAIAGCHAFGSLTGGPLVSAKLNDVAPPLPTGRTDAVAIRTQALVSRLLARPIRQRCRSVEEVFKEIDELRVMCRTSQTDPPEQPCGLEEEEIATVCLPANQGASPVAQMVAAQQLALRRMASQASGKEPSAVDDPPTNPGYSPASRRSLSSLSPSEVQIPASSPQSTQRPVIAKRSAPRRRPRMGNAMLAVVSVVGGAALASIVLYLSGKTPVISSVPFAKPSQTPAASQPGPDPSATASTYQAPVDLGPAEEPSRSAAVGSLAAGEATNPSTAHSTAPPVSESSAEAQPGFSGTASSSPLSSERPAPSPAQSVPPPVSAAASVLSL